MASSRLLTVRHVTTYRYACPVRLGDRPMMFRPRESHDLRLVRTRLSIFPEPRSLGWLHDVFDNSLAVEAFDGPKRTDWSLDSEVTLEHIEATAPGLRAGPTTSGGGGCSRFAAPIRDGNDLDLVRDAGFVIIPAGE